jgi:hypothetical protein
MFQDVREHLFTTGIVTTRLRERAKTTPEKGPLKRAAASNESAVPREGKRDS